MSGIIWILITWVEAGHLSSRFMWETFGFLSNINFILSSRQMSNLQHWSVVFLLACVLSLCVCFANWPHSEEIYRLEHKQIIICPLPEYTQVTFICYLVLAKYRGLKNTSSMYHYLCLRLHTYPYITEITMVYKAVVREAFHPKCTSYHSSVCKFSLATLHNQKGKLSILV